MRDSFDVVVQGFIDKMLAPPKEEDQLANFLKTGWWKKDLALGLSLGIVLGLVFYFLIGQRSNQTGSRQVNHAAVITLPAPPRVPSLPEVFSPEASRLKKLLNGEFKPRLIALAPSKVACPYNRLLRKGWRSYRSRNYRLAGNFFGRAVHLNPKRTAAHFGLAISLFEQGQEEQALRILDWAARKTGPKAAVWVLAGSIYQRMGKEEIARMMYQRYLSQYPHGAFARDLRVILAEKRLPCL
ncbi:MAG: tetratricopeptide repeat protein [Deltaproteobacteria bacterium]|nr:tetratricopeptide repeat protein [Deltaproteobacteria bacterium]